MFLDAAEAVDKKVGWHNVRPTLLGVLTLVGVRDRLRQQNLFDTGLPEPSDGCPPFDPRFLKARTLDGTYTDVSRPLLAAADTRFGSHVPL